MCVWHYLLYLSRTKHTYAITFCHKFTSKMKISHNFHAIFLRITIINSMIIILNHASSVIYKNIWKCYNKTVNVILTATLFCASKNASQKYETKFVTHTQLNFILFSYNSHLTQRYHSHSLYTWFYECFLIKISNETKIIKSMVNNYKSVIKTQQNLNSN